ncbi:actin depolymerizing factor [Fusarium austroafricanum]|uniref:Actin depolymerizing factor n=1 Tax=Fusarium austroafricanum TaxID=2364996 RepID=A0A8H4KTY1_9HYPO|nr:actin depolymerizing factor [Fusarium austroafricanum]
MRGNKLHQKGPSIAVYDFGESVEHKIAFISWVPDHAPARTKMFLDIEASDVGDLGEEDILEKLRAA